MELPRSLAWEMISQQACGPDASHRWKVGLDVCVCVRIPAMCVCESTPHVILRVCDLVAWRVGSSKSIALRDNVWPL